MLLDRLLGADLVFCGDAKYSDIYGKIEKDSSELLREGIKIYMILLGGSNPLGSLSYVRAMTEELVQQCEHLGIKPQAIITAAGRRCLPRMMWNPGCLMRNRNKS